MTVPERLCPGDEIRVVAPSRSLSAVKPGVAERAAQRLSELGFRVTYARRAAESGPMNSADTASRIGDLHEAFADPNVKAVLSAIGGFNVNGILDGLDYGLIGRHPKILCGYSDITALLCAVQARTGLVTYHGPHFSTFGFEEGRAYTEAWFRSCVMTGEPCTLQPCDETWTVISEGESEGKIIGGNLCTLNLLQATPWMPDLRGTLLFLEDDSITVAKHAGA